MKELKCFTITLDYGSGAFPTFEQYISKKKEIDNMLRHIGMISRLILNLILKNILLVFLMISKLTSILPNIHGL